LNRKRKTKTEKNWAIDLPAKSAFATGQIHFVGRGCLVWGSGAGKRVSVKSCVPFALLLLLSSCEILFPAGPEPYGPNDYAIGEAQSYPQMAAAANPRP